MVREARSLQAYRKEGQGGMPVGLCRRGRSVSERRRLLYLRPKPETLKVEGQASESDRKDSILSHEDKRCLSIFCQWVKRA